jgi:hypothetical protein
MRNEIIIRQPKMTVQMYKELAQTIQEYERGILDLITQEQYNNKSNELFDVVYKPKPLKIIFLLDRHPGTEPINFLRGISPHRIPWEINLNGTQVYMA